MGDADSNVSRRASRRAVLSGGLGAALALGTAGCLSLGSGTASTTMGPPPEPVSLAGGKMDDNGGMTIGEHHGPNGQVFYANHAPAGHDNPAWFHTLVHGLFPYHFARIDDGWTARAIYVTDYSTVDYGLETIDGRAHISSHVAPETFGDATAMTYVVESDVHGGMGQDLLPFSDGGDASAFVDEHGGRTVAFDDVDESFVADYRR